MKEAVYYLATRGLVFEDLPHHIADLREVGPV